MIELTVGLVIVGIVAAYFIGGFMGRAIWGPAKIKVVDWEPHHEIFRNGKWHCLDCHPRSCEMDVPLSHDDEDG